MHRSIWVLAVASTFALSVQAAPEDACRSWSGLAKTIMTSRQNGMAMSDMMDAVGNKETATVSKKLIVMAYEKPRFSTPENKQNAITDFQNDVYLHCIKSAE